MWLYGLFNNAPLWVIFLMTALIFLLFYDIGFRAGQWRRKRRDHEHEVGVRSMVQIMAGLLTFMLAFTFWIAASHFDAARQALLNEASAIKTTYLRADFLPEPKRTE